MSPESPQSQKAYIAKLLRFVVSKKMVSVNQADGDVAVQPYDSMPNRFTTLKRQKFPPIPLLFRHFDWSFLGVSQQNMGRANSQPLLGWLLSR